MVETKKVFETPSLDVVMISVSDVITTSGKDNWDGGEF